NQPKLLAAIQTHFFDHLENDLKELQYRYHETLDDGHGRIDERLYYLTKVPRDFAPAKDWPWVKAIGYSVRITRHADGRESDEVRYYLSSRYLSGKRFGEAVRGHWGIESMHWVLDVNFREDDSRTRERTLGNNLSWLRRFAVTLLQRHPAEAYLGNGSWKPAAPAVACRSWGSRPSPGTAACRSAAPSGSNRLSVVPGCRRPSRSAF